MKVLFFLIPASHVTWFPLLFSKISSRFFAHTYSGRTREANVVRTSPIINSPAKNIAGSPKRDAATMGYQSSANRNSSLTPCSIHLLLTIGDHAVASRRCCADPPHHR
ncbi:hypothetical protein EDD85DRAFT_867022 [Armillaria nabsnona]|nr:hypothetical protein EDD85DRAFT_867022 [Armillaria nabsnona]